MNRLPIAAALLLLGACIPEEGPMMDPGEDCRECHGGGESDGPAWSVSGTVFGGATGGGVRGAEIRIVDARGRHVTLHSNDAGNFYLADALRFPLQVSVARNGEVETMPDPVEYGGCNGCHGDEEERLTAP